MDKGRWHPTTTTLANGEVLVIAGRDEMAELNVLPQVWQSTSGWRHLTNARTPEGHRLELPCYPRMHVAPGDAYPPSVSLLTRAGKNF